MPRSKLVVAALLVASSVSAQTEPIALEWRAPPGCPSEADVRSEIERLLGGPPNEKSERRVRARAEVKKTADRWSLRIDTDVAGKKGARSLESASCQGLAEATALIVALAFDPDAVALTQAKEEPSEQPVTPAPEPKSPPRVKPAPRPRPVPRAARVPSRRVPPAQPLVWLVGAYASGDVGALPAPAVGIEGLVGLEVWNVRMELGAAYWLDQRATIEGTEAGGKFEFFTVMSAGCYLVLRGRFEIGLCPGAEIGRMHATGFGVDHPDESTLLWGALSARITAGFQLVGPLYLHVAAGAVLPFDRPHWILEGVGEVDRPGPVTARGNAGIELHL